MAMIIGKRPHPRLLLIGIPDNVVETFRSKYRTVDTAEAPNEVEQAEYDAIIAAKNWQSADTSLRLIVFASTPGDILIYVVVEGGGSYWLSLSTETSRAREFTVPAGLPPPVTDLATRIIVPVLQSEVQNPPIIPFHPGMSPIVMSPRKEPFACMTSRTSATGTNCWILPAAAVSEAMRVFEVAARVWRSEEPDHFPPPVADWRSSPRWQTPTELRVLEERNALQAERDAALAGFASREDDLLSQAASAQRDADSGVRTILTSQGETLVHGVAALFERLGFHVRRMDEVWPTGARREDLRLTITDDPEWETIVEVRGYIGGSQLNDLARLHGRFRTQYIHDEKRLPSATWYIANEFIATHPSTRPAILQSNDDELSAFAEDEVLAIATTTLFDLAMDVEAGAMSPVAARGLLMSRRGRFVYERSRA
jgi:hypothetical protein